MVGRCTAITFALTMVCLAQVYSPCVPFADVCLGANFTVAKLANGMKNDFICGSNFRLLILVGSLMASGDNYFNQLGIPNISVTYPVFVKNLSVVEDVFCGCMLKY